MIIRPFRNTDLPRLLEIWIQHWSSFGPPPELNSAKFEQAVMARNFFRPSELLVAEEDGEITGWIATAPSQSEATTTMVCALCFLPSNDAVGEKLLDAAEVMSQQAGFDKMQVGLVRDQAQGYAGLDPIGHGIAIPSMDARTTELLRNAGFSSDGEIIRMTASTHGYRPPVSRDSMQFRRSSQISTQTHVYDQPRRAAAMSHLDVESTRLLGNAGDEIAALKLWYSDPEAEVMDPSMAIIELSDAHGRGYLIPGEIYLIGASIQALERRRVMSVETSVDANKPELIEQLEKLKFHPGDQGAQWEKKYS